MYWKTPYIVRKLFKRQLWNFSRSEKVIYLTFDDGPTPEVTERVLSILNQYKAKATFFCLGRNVDRNPEIYKQIIAAGHRTGNHTYSHLRGWRTPVKGYMHDINLAKKYIKSDLFRPPYGRIRDIQTRLVSKEYRIIMWEVLSHDYNNKLPENWCLKHTIKNTRNGSIVVFHDSVKASKNLFHTLPTYLEHFTKLGYSFKCIE